MYVCEICNTIVLPNTPSTLLVLQTRKRSYPSRNKANKFLDPKKPGKNQIIYSDDPGGFGFEIEREVRVCPECANFGIKDC